MKYCFCRSAGHPRPSLRHLLTSHLERRTTLPSNQKRGKNPYCRNRKMIGIGLFRNHGQKSRVNLALLSAWTSFFIVYATFMQCPKPHSARICHPDRGHKFCGTAVIAIVCFRHPGAWMLHLRSFVCWSIQRGHTC